MGIIILCKTCIAPFEYGIKRVYCSTECFKYGKLLRSRQRYKRQRDGGICISCPRPAKIGMSRCSRCLLVAVSRKIDRVEDGKCRGCSGKRLSKFQSCSKCKKKNRKYCSDRYALYRSMGLCGHCGIREATTPYVTCKPCRTINTQRVANGRLRRRSR